MSHVTHMNESLHTGVSTWPVTDMNDSRHTCLKSHESLRCIATGFIALCIKGSWHEDTSHGLVSFIPEISQHSCFERFNKLAPLDTRTRISDASESTAECHDLWNICVMTHSFKLYDSFTSMKLLIHFWQYFVGISPGEKSDRILLHRVNRCCNLKECSDVAAQNHWILQSTKSDWMLPQRVFVWCRLERVIGRCRQQSH
mmetsp:Transcript_73113/g.118603  ORF Transcript_73113/g.118603 Transcript_73113/m.118603 type:complete len:200 (-) Transcript_73113:1486-2085(-)